jgi:cell division inhibitor SepF
MAIVGFADMQTVGTTYLSGQIVELRLDGIDADLARRATDFATGMVFATHGRMTKAARARFHLIPPDRGPDTA